MLKTFDDLSSTLTGKCNFLDFKKKIVLIKFQVIEYFFHVVYCIGNILWCQIFVWFIIGLFS